MPDEAHPDELTPVPVQAAKSAESRPTTVLGSPPSERWWRQSVPLWWSILVGLAALISGVSVTLWAVNLQAPAAAPLAVLPRDVEPPVVASSATVASGADLILPTPTATVASALPSLPAPSPTPTVPAPPPTATTPPPAISMQMETVVRSYEEALARRDAVALRTALEAIEQPEMAASPEVNALRSRLLYALDAISGTMYLEAHNTLNWDLLDDAGRPLVLPVDFTITDDALYVIDSGALYRHERDALPSSGGALTMAPVIAPGDAIDGFPTKEIVAVAAFSAGRAVYVLDKSGDIYYSETGAGDWQLARTVVQEQSDPDPFIINITTWSEWLYGLDPARNQIWRHPPREGSSGVLPGILPWQLSPGDADVSDGLDMAVAGFVYVLLRDGRVVKLAPTVAGYFDLDQAAHRSHVPELEGMPSRPLRIALDAAGSALYVADPDRRRVVVLAREDGAFLGQLVGASSLDFAHLRAVAERAGRLYMLAGARLYAHAVGDWEASAFDLAGSLPVWASYPPPDPSAVHPQDLPPNDPRLLDLLAAMPFRLPVHGLYLPDRASSYPGTRRAYRYGVHEGLDFYNNDPGAEIRVGSPVFAVLDGMVARSDLDYVAMSITDTQAFLDEAHALRFTPPETLNLLGGRQVWLDHGNGVMTRYLHLSDIPEHIQIGQSVQAGDTIGFVGLSGTLDGWEGRDHLAHLHFEIWVGPEWRYPFGQWLTVEDTRRALERIFKAPARPKDWQTRGSGP